MFYRRKPANNNHKKRRRRREPEPEITAYPRSHWEEYHPPAYRNSQPTYTNAYLERLGWCMECKENPCQCVELGDVWIEPD